MTRPYNRSGRIAAQKIMLPKTATKGSRRALIAFKSVRNARVALENNRWLAQHAQLCEIEAQLKSFLEIHHAAFMSEHFSELDE